MAFFTKAEIKQRMIEKEAELGPEDARADLNLALIILGSALFEKRLKSGRDYGEHPLFVGLNNTRSIAKIIIGFLHDIVEDSDWTIDDLRDVRFSERVVKAVDALTKRPGELYFDFIERCGMCEFALDQIKMCGRYAWQDSVDKKIEDISHNLDESRSDIILDAKDLERMNKYKVSKAYLLSIKKGKIEPGSSLIDFVNSRKDFKDNLTVQFLLAKYSSQGVRPANDILSIEPNSSPGSSSALAP